MKEKKQRPEGEAPSAQTQSQAPSSAETQENKAPENPPIVEPEGNDGPGPLTQAMVGETYDNQQLLTRIRGMRTATDSLYRSCEFVKGAFPIPAIGRFVALATTSFQSARQFMGKMLEEKGAAYPYPPSHDAVKVADQGQVLSEILGITEIKDVLMVLRDRAQEQVVEMEIYCNQVGHLSPIDFVSQTFALGELLKAKMMLGEVYGVLANGTE